MASDGQTRLSRQRRKRLLTAGLLTLMGSSLVLGCSSSAAYEEAGLTLGEDRQRIEQARDEIRSQAREHALPAQFVAEARVGVSEIERQLADAAATQVREQARYREGSARVSAAKQEARTREQVARAEADKLRQQFEARQQSIEADLLARERELDSNIARDEALVEALAKERSTLKKDVVSQAEKQFEEAQARIDRLRNVRDTTENESLAAIDDMRESARATRARAEATSEAIRQEAESVEEQSAAAFDELGIKIDTVMKRSEAEAQRLATKAESLERDATARADELLARADALDRQARDEEYGVRVKEAESEWEQAQTIFERKKAEVASNYTRAEAQKGRLVAEADSLRSRAQAEHERDLKRLDAWLADEREEVRKLRLQAERAEAMARNAFVKAEAEARAKAAHETAAHQTEVAEEKRKALTAEAAAEATRLRAEILEDLADKQRRGRVDAAGKTGPAAEDPEDLHDVPEGPEVEPVTPRVEPEHVAAYRAALAEVMKDRSTADARDMAIEASFDERQSKIEATKSQNLALAAERIALATAIDIQARMRLADQTAAIEAQLAVARGARDRQLAEAEAFRKEAEALAADLRAQAESTRDIAIARAAQFRNESQMVARNGEAEAEALTAQRQAVQQRGEAEVERLLAEAESIIQSEQALASQLDAEIEAAEKRLAAELRKLDRAIASQEVVAQADYDEAMVRADVIERKADVEIARIRSKSALEQTVTAADIARGHNLLEMTRIKGEADVQRRLAEAEAESRTAEAQHEARQSHLDAENSIALAQVLADRKAAAAREAAVKAQFGARVVQTESERIQALASDFREERFRQRNIEQAMAEASAARAEARQRLEEMRQQQRELQVAAVEDWDATLADLRKEAMEGEQEFIVPEPSTTPRTAGHQTIQTIDGEQVLTIYEGDETLDDE